MYSPIWNAMVEWLVRNVQQSVFSVDNKKNAHSPANSTILQCCERVKQMEISDCISTVAVPSPFQMFWLWLERSAAVWLNERSGMSSVISIEEARTLFGTVHSRWCLAAACRLYSTCVSDRKKPSVNLLSQDDVNQTTANHSAPRSSGFTNPANQKKARLI